MKKLRSRSGMTLTETLCSLVVLLLISALLTVGTRFAVRTYQESMAVSQAQVLCSTLTAAISDKLRYCTVHEEDGQLFIQDIGKVSEDEKGGVFHVNQEDGELYLGENKLLGSASYPQGLTISDFRMEYDHKETFSVSFQIDNSEGEALSSTVFEVKCINPGTV